MQTKSSWAALWMPLSLCYIAAVLRKGGHQVKLTDAIASGMDNQKIVRETALFNPQLIILNTAIPSIKGDMECASILKKAFPPVKIAVTGVFPSIYEKESLEANPQIDYAIMDEPEWISERLPEIIEGKCLPESVRGLIFRKGNEIVINERQDPGANNLDELPFPARDLLDNNKYRLPTNGQKFTLLGIGRGCPSKCIFCMANLYYGRKFRKRSVDKIILEIEQCINDHGIRNFLFWGESFTADPRYGEEICDEINSRNIRITWSTTTRVDTLNQGLLVKMKKAGCILLGLGIESYDQNVLDNACKGITLEQIDSAVHMVREAGIKSMGHLIFGLPGDTRESAMRSIRFACKNLDYAQFYAAIPYPKTVLAKIAAENNWIVESDYSRFEQTRAVMGNGSLSAKEIIKLRDYAYRKFYFRPEMLIQALGELSSPGAFFSALNFLKWIKPARK